MYLHFNIPLFIELFRWMLRLYKWGRICNLWCYSFASFHGCSMLCFPTTGNPGCWNTVQLVKLSVGGVTQTKTKTDIPTRNTHSKVEKLSVALFFRETSELSMFPNYLQTYHRILCFCTAWKKNLHRKDNKKDTVFFLSRQWKAVLFALLHSSK